MVIITAIIIWSITYWYVSVPIIVIVLLIWKLRSKKHQLKKAEKVKVKKDQYNIVAIEKRFEMARLEKKREEKKRKERQEYLTLHPKPKPLCPNCKNELTNPSECDLCGWSKEKKVEEEMRSRRIPQRVKNEVWRRDGGRCVECGSRFKLEYDHIIPFSKGGSNTARNIELLCEKCNRKKYNKI